MTTTFNQTRSEWCSVLCASGCLRSEQQRMRLRRNVYLQAFSNLCVCVFFFFVRWSLHMADRSQYRGVRHCPENHDSS